MYTNIDSLLNKRIELNALVNYHKPDIIALTEIKPKRCRYSIEPCEIEIDGYDLFHNLNSPGRGVAIYTTKSIKASSCVLFNNNDFSEALFVECNLNSADRLLVGAFYRSPNSDEINNNNMNDLFTSIGNSHYTHLLLLGDFNYREINWADEVCNTTPAHPAYKFLQCTKDLFFIQNQLTCTRYREGQVGSVLDLIFTNEDRMIDEVYTLANIGKSDHLTLLFDYKCYATFNTEKPTYDKYDKGDYKSMGEELGKIKWKDKLDNQTLEDSWLELKRHIFNSKNKYIPNSQYNNKKHSKWSSSATRIAVKEKSKKFNKWLKTKKQSDYIEFRRASNKCKKICKKAKKDYETNVAKDAKQNPKKFWSYINSKLKTKSGIADLIREDGSKATIECEKSDILNKFFTSTFTVENLNDLPSPPCYELTSRLRTIDFTPEEVLCQLENLNVNKTYGPDGIHPRLLKELGGVLALPLAIIFNHSMSTKELPTDWKLANITPIFKQGNKNDPNNYRPVSLTSVVCKVMERIIKERVTKHLLDNKIIHSAQHGFLRGRSCLTNLLEVLDTCTRWIEDGDEVDVVYTDFKKAFDKVPHARLLLKCQAVGIEDSMLGWIESFLKGRMQRVVISGSSSEWFPVTSGVPQGSVLGPLLFLIYINDLPNAVESFMKLFADDAKVLNTKNNASLIQTDINRIIEWSDKWQMPLNVNKCEVLHIGVTKNLTVNNYTMMHNSTNVNIKSTNLEKDLGVWVDSQLKFEEHIMKMVSKANRTVGLIRRSFDFLDAQIFSLLFKGIVRPMLEYGQVVWSPRYAYLTQEIENVQRRATKLIPGFNNIDYEQRLQRLNLPSLENRRLRGDLIEAFKYIRGYYAVDNKLFELSNVGITRGHQYKVKHHYSRLDVRKHFFTNRVANTWNKLPADIVSADSINTFKNRLDRHWKTSKAVHNHN